MLGELFEELKRCGLELIVLLADTLTHNRVCALANHHDLVVWGSHKYRHTLPVRVELNHIEVLIHDGTVPGLAHRLQILVYTLVSEAKMPGAIDKSQLIW